MPLTPADIHNVAFKKPPIGKRGYDEEEVDAFLDEAEQEIIRLLEENGALKDQMQRGGGGAGMPSTRGLSAEFADLTAQLERLRDARDRAEQNARSVQAQLERARSATPAGPMPTAGDDERNVRVLMMAQRTADDHMLDAKRESDGLLSHARTKAEQITSEAQLEASTIEGDARRNHSEAMATLDARRTDLLDEIGRLGQLARSYQSALNDHVNRQMQDLDSAPDVPVS